MSKKNIYNVFTAIMTIGVQFAIGLILTPYIVKHLGESANGYTQLANNFVAYASLITLAFNSMAGRFMSVSFHQHRVKDMNSYYSSVVSNNIIISAILIPISLFIVVYLEKIIVIDTKDVMGVKVLFACVFINFFVNMIISISGSAFFVTNKIFIRNVINCLVVVVRAVLLFIAFVFFGAKIYFVTMTALIASVIGMGLIIFYRKKILPELHFERELCSVKYIRELLKSGVWNTVNQCGTMLLTGMDLLLSNLFINPLAMGLLSVAKTMPNAIDTLATSVNSSFTPAITSAWAVDDKNKILCELKNDMKISTIILSTPIMVFLAFSTDFYNLWVPTLDAKALAILSVLSCMHYIPATGTTCVYNVFTSSNKLKVSSLLFVGSGILNVIIVFFLLSVTDWGVYVIAGVSSVLNIVRNTFVILPYVSYILNVKWYYFFKNVIISIICAIVNLVISFVVKCFISTNGWIALITAICVTCVLTFFSDSMIVLGKEERKKLATKMKEKILMGYKKRIGG